MRKFIFLFISSCSTSLRYQSYQCDSEPDAVYVMFFNKKELKWAKYTPKIESSLYPISYHSKNRYQTSTVKDDKKNSIQKIMLIDETFLMRREINPHNKEFKKLEKEFKERDISFQEFKDGNIKLMELYPDPTLNKEQEKIVLERVNNKWLKLKNKKPTIVQKNIDDTVTITKPNGEVQNCLLKIAKLDINKNY